MQLTGNVFHIVQQDGSIQSIFREAAYIHHTTIHEGNLVLNRGSGAAQPRGAQSFPTVDGLR